MKLNTILFAVLIITVSIIISVSFYAFSREYNGSMIRLGYFDKRARGFQTVNIPDGQSAVYIENKGYIGKIKNVRYFIGRFGEPPTPFKLRLYAKGSDNKPGNELLPNGLTVNAMSYGWLTVDIQSYNICFPASGCFVAMEWLPFYETKIAREDKNSQSLAYTISNGSCRTWYSTIGRKWYQLENDFNAMISIEIELE